MRSLDARQSVVGLSLGVQVKMAREEHNGNMYAIKAISKRRLKRKGGLRRGRESSGLLDLEREVSILTKIRHRHIVRLFEVMNDPDHDAVYMVFELLKASLLPALPLACPLTRTHPCKTLQGVGLPPNRSCLARSPRQPRTPRVVRLTPPSPFCARAARSGDGHVQGRINQVL